MASSAMAVIKFQPGFRRVDIAVNGTYWLCALIGTIGEYVLLNKLDEGPRAGGWGS